MVADGTRRTRSGPKPPLTGAALRKAILAIWCVAFCGMQWRAISLLRTDAEISDAFGSSILKAFRPVHSSKLHHLFPRLSLACCATFRSARSTPCSPAGPVWRRLLNRLILAWRQACGDTADPSAVIIDSRSCQSAPTCFTRGFDGGKKIKGIKIHLAVDK
jgi:hypothetical protein